MDRELIIPPIADASEDGFEILRVWAAGGSQHVAIRSNLEGGAGGFGYMLAQLAQHGARLYAERQGCDVSEALFAIQEAFDGELYRPSTTPEGTIVGD